MVRATVAVVGVLILVGYGSAARAIDPNVSSILGAVTRAVTNQVTNQMNQPPAGQAPAAAPSAPAAAAPPPAAPAPVAAPAAKPNARPSSYPADKGAQATCADPDVVEKIARHYTHSTYGVPKVSKARPGRPSSGVQVCNANLDQGTMEAKVSWELRDGQIQGIRLSERP